MSLTQVPQLSPFALPPTRQSRYGDGARYRRVSGQIAVVKQALDGDFPTAYPMHL